MSGLVWYYHEWKMACIENHFHHPFAPSDGTHSRYGEHGVICSHGESGLRRVVAASAAQAGGTDSP
jgi:hypothetical protein